MNGHSTGKLSLCGVVFLLFVLVTEWLILHIVEHTIHVVSRTGFTTVSVVVEELRNTRPQVRCPPGVVESHAV